MLRFLMEHIRPKSSLGYKLKIHCSFGIFDIFEVIAKTSFSKIAKCSTLFKAALYRYGKIIKGQDEEVDSCFYRPDSAALEVLESCSQLYQFSDVLMCKNHIHSTALTGK